MTLKTTTKNMHTAETVMWISLAIFVIGMLIVIANMSERANLIGNLATIAGAAMLFCSYIAFRIIKEKAEETEGFGD